MPLCSSFYISHKVTHLNGDFLAVGPHLQTGGYDAVVSWLTILHFVDRSSVFKIAYSLVRPGGKFYAADFYQKSEFTAS